MSAGSRRTRGCVLRWVLLAVVSTAATEALAQPADPGVQSDGAYVVVPGPSTTSPTGEAGSGPSAGEVAGPGASTGEEWVNDDGELYMGMFAVRPFATHLGEGPAPEDPEGLVGGHVGLRGHAFGLDDELVGRFDVEAFIGASSEGVEGEGRGFVAVGLAHAVASRHHIMFRIGAGGALLGNPVVDYQIASLPALEVGWVKTGPVVVDVAPRIAMGVVQMSVFDGALAPDPAPAVGGRVLAGGSPLWGELDVDVVSGDHPLVRGALTACWADRFALCLDGRLASASLDVGGGSFERTTAISGGLSIGLGAIDTKD